jgi:hypothetical protein
MRYRNAVAMPTCTMSLDVKYSMFHVQLLLAASIEQRAAQSLEINFNK